MGRQVLRPWPHDGANASVALMTGIVSSRDLRRSWFLSVTVGEFAGFAAPALTAAALSGTADRVFVPAMLLAGAIEGAVLGFAQARVLRRALDDLPVVAWTGVTAAAAVVAYVIGFAPAQLGNRLTEVPPAVLTPLASVAAVVLLATIGFAQWTLLRQRVSRAWRWIPVTAAAWAAGLGAFIAVTTPLWQPHQPIALVAAIGLLGGLVMAATVAAITGAALPHLLLSPARTHSTPHVGA
jgi:hypothetical protein